MLLNFRMPSLNSLPAQSPEGEHVAQADAVCLLCPPQPRVKHGAQPTGKAPRTFLGGSFPEAEAEAFGVSGASSEAGKEHLLVECGAQATGSSYMTRADRNAHCQLLNPSTPRCNSQRCPKTAIYKSV